nr:TIGR01741 family protein [Staphylococcus aureus]
MLNPLFLSVSSANTSLSLVALCPSIKLGTKNDDLNYYTDIPKEYNISVQVFDDLWMDLYDLFEELRDLFKEEDLEPWTSCEFDFTSEGKLKVSLDYIDWINTEFDQLGRENYYMYKKFGVIPEMEYEMEEIKEIEQYIKEQDEAEL